MYYGRYSREYRRWITSWPLPSELIAHAKIEPKFQVVDAVEGDGSIEPSDEARIKVLAE